MLYLVQPELTPCNTINTAKKKLRLSLSLASVFLLSQRNFVEEKLGVKYTEGRKTEFAKSYRESGPTSPVFFILSPGVDPLKDVESLGI